MIYTYKNNSIIKKSQKNGKMIKKKDKKNLNNILKSKNNVSQKLLLKEGGYIPIIGNHLYDYKHFNNMVFNRNTLYFALSLFTLSTIYSKLTGNKNIILIIKNILKRFVDFIKKNTSSAFLIILLSNILWLSEENLIVKLQNLVDEVNYLFFQNNGGLSESLDLSWENIIFFIIISLIIGMISYTGLKKIIGQVLSSTFKFFFTDEMINQKIIIYFNCIWNYISEWNKLKFTITSISVINIVGMIVDDIFDYIESLSFDSKNLSVSNFKSSIKELIDFGTKFYEEDKVLTRTYKYTKVSLIFINRASWSLVRTGTKIINYPILGCKFTGFKIPISKRITGLEDYKLTINFGLTPIMIFITLVSTYLIFDYREKVLSQFEKCIYLFFILISTQKNKILKINDSDEFDKIYKNDNIIVFFYTRKDFKNMEALVKFYMICSEHDIHYLYDIYTFCINFEEDKNFLKKYNIVDTPQIIFYKNSNQNKKLTKDQILSKDFQNVFLNSTLDNFEINENTGHKNNILDILENRENYKYITLFFIEKLKNTLTLFKKSKYYFINLILGSYFEDVLYDIYDKVSYSNVIHYYDYNKKLESLFSSNNLFLLYLYDDPITITKSYSDYESKYNSISRYSNLENYNSFLEFYTISTLIGNNTKKMDYILMNIDVFNKISYKPYFDKSPNELSLFYGSKEIMVFDSYIPFGKSEGKDIVYKLISKYKELEPFLNN